MFYSRVFYRGLVVALLFFLSCNPFKTQAISPIREVTGIFNHHENFHLNFDEGYVWFWDEFASAGGDGPGNDVENWGGNLGAFHNASEIWAKLHSLEHHFPSIIQLADLGFSYNGRLILLVIITDESVQSFKKEVLIVAHHHGREVITIENCLYYIDKLVYEFQNKNSTIQELLAKRIIYVIPTLNPDSLDIVYRWPYVRKNLHPIDEDGDGIRDEEEILYNYDSRDNDTTIGEDFPGGVDLNRNYPFQWNNTSDNSADPHSFVYRGASPFSEPETRAFAEFVRKHDFQSATSLHSGVELILTPWAYDPQIDCPDEEVYINLAVELTRVTGIPHTDLYPATGEWGDWMYGARGIVSVTIETYRRENAAYVWDYFNPPPNKVLAVSERVYPGLLLMTSYTRQELQIDPLENITRSNTYSPTEETTPPKIVLLAGLLGSWIVSIVIRKKVKKL